MFSFACENQLHDVRWTKKDVFTIFSQHKNSWISHIQWLITAAKPGDVIRQKVSVYADPLATEAMLDDYDKDLISYFRQLGYSVIVGFSQPTGQVRLYPVYIEISV